LISSTIITNNSNSPVVPLIHIAIPFKLQFENLDVSVLLQLEGHIDPRPVSSVLHESHLQLLLQLLQSVGYEHLVLVLVEHLECQVEETLAVVVHFLAAHLCDQLFEAHTVAFGCHLPETDQ